jgi:hypothetical protein
VCYQIQQLDAPPAGAIGLFLLAYLICLVPVNYAILKRRDRKEWAWVTTPAIVLVFSFLAYGVGWGIKGGQLVLARAGIVEARVGSRVALAESYLGLFSPRKASYDLTVASPDATLSHWNAWAERGSETLHLVEGETWSAAHLDVGMWSMRILRADLPLELGEGLIADWQGTAQPWRIRAGSVSNRTPWDLEECRLVHGNEWIELGSLRRGATVDLAGRRVESAAAGLQSLAERVRGDGSSSRMQRALLRALPARPSGPPLFVAWIRAPLFPVTVDGRAAREESMHLLVVHL